MLFDAGTVRGLAALGLALAGGATIFAAGNPAAPPDPAPSAQQAPPIETHCSSALSGRTLTVTQPSFGAVQGRPNLPLRKGEYVLTIDDGPSLLTPRILAILKKYCVKATFMNVGRMADRYPQSVQAQLAAGHGVGSHSYSHGGFGAMDDDGQHADILHGAEAVMSAGGLPHRQQGEASFYRTPGDIGVPLQTQPAMLAFLQAQKLILAGYDISPQDWRNDPAVITYGRLLTGLPDRGVIVLHDGPTNTPMLLDMALGGFERRGAHIVHLQLPSAKAGDPSK